MGDYQRKYIKYKSKYLDLKKSFEQDTNIQKGGGAWGAFSNDNDSTQDLMSKYKFIEYADDTITYHKDVKSTTSALKKLFQEFDKNIKKQDKGVKNTDTSIYNLNYRYLGVIIELLLHLYPIPKEFLKRALIHAYREYIRISITKEASGWASYQDRLNSLKYEILLINYAINKGTPIKIPTNLLKTNENNSYLDEDDLVKFIDDLVEKKSKDIMDNIFLDHKKIKPQYSFLKYEYLPVLNPTILDIGTIMKGYSGRGTRKATPFWECSSIPKRGTSVYFVVNNKNNKHIWKHYDPFDDTTIGYISIDIMYDIYGENITKLNQKDIREIE